jgi:hypothetical protein
LPEDEPQRSTAARLAAEQALVRVVGHYGDRPEFVLLGGLVPALLCANAPRPHAGTTDIDVQVNLEISGGAVNAARLEEALLAAGFVPDNERIWRWTAVNVAGHTATVKFELLADLDTEPSGATVRFQGAQNLGAANLRGTGFAARDSHVVVLMANDEGVHREAEVNVTGPAGFLLAKAAAAAGRHKPKDWYDIAYVLLHSDSYEPRSAAVRVLDVLGPITGSTISNLIDLRANFDGAQAQGTQAYVEQITLDDPEIDRATATADCQLAVEAFCDILLESTG